MMLRRRVLPWTIALTCVIAAAVAIPAYVITAAPRSAEQENEPIVHRGVTACGVERWRVKVGLDAGARQVDLSKVVPTTIFHLRSLTPPSDLAAYSRTRIRPTETTVFQVSATLLRVKMEQDSDFHLVLSDSGGRTMIAEIPAPQCTGSNDPFLSKIIYTRRVFTARFHPTGSWERGSWPVVVTGIGFFDFPHGQSGMAPNAIELHPVLNIKFGAGSSSAPPPKKQPTPKPPAHGSFSVSATVSPNPVSYGQYATLYARSAPGASCSASVVYSTGRPPRSFNGSAQTVGSSSVVSWSWHMESRGSGGTATVKCTLHAQTKTATTTFSIA